MKTPVNKKGFIQINIVVSDIEKAAAKWADLLGIETPEIHLNHLEGNEHYKYHGKPRISSSNCMSPPAAKALSRNSWISTATASTTSALRWATPATRSLPSWQPQATIRTAR